jgi:hypothetical protein
MMVNTSTNVNTTIPPRSTKQSALSNMDLTLRGCTSNLAGKSLVFIYSQATTSTLFFKLPVSRLLASNIEGKIGELTVRRTSSFINNSFYFLTH